MSLPRAFLDRPLAHRGLHDRARGTVENSHSAFNAAIAQGYGIELDVQISADCVPMVFHDATLDRLTAQTGPVRDRRAADLSRIALVGSTDTIPTLAQVLDQIDGRVATLVEIKDQSQFGPSDQRLDQEVGHVIAAAHAAHDGPLAVMSFNPEYAATLDWLGDTIPRGITTGTAADYPEALPQDLLNELVGVAHYGPSGASFISHNRTDLDNPRVAALKAEGAAILCWTVRSEAEEHAARHVADNITFEHYLPA